MRKIMTGMLFLVLAGTLLTGCGRIGGPRFWWDDRNQVRLTEGYNLPPDPAASEDESNDYVAAPSGEDLTEDNLRDYRTNLDQEEEKRKSEASLLDF